MTMYANWIEFQIKNKRYAQKYENNNLFSITFCFYLVEAPIKLLSLEKWRTLESKYDSTFLIKFWYLYKNKTNDYSIDPNSKFL